MMSENTHLPDTATFILSRIDQVMKKMTVGKYDAALPYTAAARPNLTAMRKQSPREISEHPESYKYESTNLGLLQLLFSQLHENDRDEFIDGLLFLVEHGGETELHAEYHFPKFEIQVSELPLVAEFVIRNGYADKFLVA
jgi:hypothetical protein